MSIVGRYVGFLEKRGKVVLALTLLAMVGAVFGIVRMRILTDFNIFMPHNSVFIDNLDQMTESFGDSGQLVALV